jgi:hypothetical protein
MPGGRPENPVETARLLEMEQETVSGRRLAEKTGYTDQYISDLAAKKVLKRSFDNRFPYIPSILALLAYVRAQKSGRAPLSGVSEIPNVLTDRVDGNLERALLWREQREAQSLRNGALRGELLPADEIKAALTATTNAVKAKLLAIPTKGAPLLLGTDSLAVMQDRLTELVHECCAELSAEIAFEAIADHNKRLAAFGGDVDGPGAVAAKALDATAPLDGEPVGRPISAAKSGSKRGARNMENGSG